MNLFILVMLVMILLLSANGAPVVLVLSFNLVLSAVATFWYGNQYIVAKKPSDMVVAILWIVALSMNLLSVASLLSR